MSIRKATGFGVTPKTNPLSKNQEIPIIDLTQKHEELDDSLSESTQAEMFDMEDIVPEVHAEVREWLADFGAEILRKEIQIYLKTQKLELNYELRECKKQKPVIKKQNASLDLKDGDGDKSKDPPLKKRKRVNHYYYKDEEGKFVYNYCNDDTCSECYNKDGKLIIKD